MKPYLAMFRIRFRLLLQYRAAALAGMACQVFWGVMRMMIFLAFLENCPTPPISGEHVVSYIWLGQAMLLWVMLGVDTDLQHLIRSGDVACELLRPVDLYLLWFSRTLARRLAPGLMRAIPILLIATVCGWLKWPGLIGTLVFLITSAGAILLSSAICMLMVISLFWTISGQGVVRLVAATSMLFSGLVIPLPLFPDSWQMVLSLSPFAGIGDLPWRLFMGHLPPDQVWHVLALQASWIVVLMSLGHWLTARALRVLVVQGG